MRQPVEYSRLHLRLPEPLRVQLNSIAWRKRRSMTDEIMLALEKHVETETKKASDLALGKQSDASSNTL